ncbi:hypothetical protein [Quisquiliibacterium transsilvanicum]|uniref:Uncharacterized protein n=1 Tax=Quisquiliibacterium transsilvanicum TaxID=1549638 RepID=A0A7W8HG43_9BURK|nr:hypothetical protein [Quisquiliibacterium transsilvanicum]MBB5271308.1 hypothetical protein [Quisquiliibacterium transsilvanicum]
MKDETAHLAPELAITETEWQVIQWLRTQTGCAFAALITAKQKRLFDAFVESLRESPTVH